MTWSGTVSRLILDTNIYTSMESNNFSKMQLDCFSLQHTVVRVQSEASGTFGKKKVLLLYFKQGCTVQSHSHSQSPRLNPFTSEGVCLRIALTLAPASLSLPCPSKAYWQIFTQDFSLKSLLSQVYIFPHPTL